MKSKYDKSIIFKNAWKSFKAQSVRTDEMFSICLKNAWAIAKNAVNAIDINALYKKYYNEILNVVVSRGIKDIESAREVANDVFVKAHTYLNSYDANKSKIRTWLINIAKNEAINRYRTDHSDKYVNVESYVDDEGRETYQIADDNEASDNVENEELMSKIRVAMSNLKPKYQTIAELHFIEQKKYDEIAEILNIPIGSVKGMINRCRTMLQTSLQSVGVRA